MFFDVQYSNPTFTMNDIQAFYQAIPSPGATRKPLQADLKVLNAWNQKYRKTWELQPNWYYLFAFKHSGSNLERFMKNVHDDEWNVNLLYKLEAIQSATKIRQTEAPNIELPDDVEIIEKYAPDLNSKEKVEQILTESGSFENQTNNEIAIFNENNYFDDPFDFFDVKLDLISISDEKNPHINQESNDGHVEIDLLKTETRIRQPEIIHINPENDTPLPERNSSPIEMETVAKEMSPSQVEMESPASEPHENFPEDEGFDLLGRCRRLPQVINRFDFKNPHPPPQYRPPVKVVRAQPILKPVPSLVGKLPGAPQENCPQPPPRPNKDNFFRLPLKIPQDVPPPPPSLPSPPPVSIRQPKSRVSIPPPVLPMQIPSPEYPVILGLELTTKQQKALLALEPLIRAGLIRSALPEPVSSFGPKSKRGRKKTMVQYFRTPNM